MYVYEECLCHFFVVCAFVCVCVLCELRIVQILWEFEGLREEMEAKARKIIQSKVQSSKDNASHD